MGQRAEIVSGNQKMAEAPSHRRYPMAKTLVKFSTFSAVFLVVGGVVAQKAANNICAAIVSCLRGNWGRICRHNQALVKLENSRAMPLRRSGAAPQRTG